MEQKDNFVDPYWRMKRIPTLKSDHPTKNYKAEGNLFNDARPKFTNAQRSRSYTAWEPPTGKEERFGKKIVGVKPVNEGLTHQDLEQD